MGILQGFPLLFTTIWGDQPAGTPATHSSVFHLSLKTQVLPWKFTCPRKNGWKDDPFLLYQMLPLFIGHIRSFSGIFFRRHFRYSIILFCRPQQSVHPHRCCGFSPTSDSDPKKKAKLMGFGFPRLPTTIFHNGWPNDWMIKTLRVQQWWLY